MLTFNNNVEQNYTKCLCQRSNETTPAHDTNYNISAAKTLFEKQRTLITTTAVVTTYRTTITTSINHFYDPLASKHSKLLAMGKNKH